MESEPIEERSIISLKESEMLDKTFTAMIFLQKLYQNFNGEGWIMVPDDSLSNGAEINTPKLTDCEDTWIDLNYECRIVAENAYVMDNTSAHVHIGTQILGKNPKYWRNFSILWATYENVIYRFFVFY